MKRRIDESKLRQELSNEEQEQEMKLALMYVCAWMEKMGIPSVQYSNEIDGWHYVVTGLIAHESEPVTAWPETEIPEGDIH